MVVFRSGLDHTVFELPLHSSLPLPPVERYKKNSIQVHIQHGERSSINGHGNRPWPGPHHQSVLSSLSTPNLLFREGASWLVSVMTTAAVQHGPWSCLTHGSQPPLGLGGMVLPTITCLEPLDTKIWPGPGDLRKLVTSRARRRTPR